MRRDLTPREKRAAELLLLSKEEIAKKAAAMNLPITPDKYKMVEAIVKNEP